MRNEHRERHQARRHQGDQKVHQAATQFRDVFDVRKMVVKKNYSILYRGDSIKKVTHFIYRPNSLDYVVIDFEDSVDVYKKRKPIKLVEKEMVGSIYTSLYIDMLEDGGNAELVNELVDIFAWQVDFFGIQKGDLYKIIYVEQVVDGEIVGIEKITAAYFEHVGDRFYAVPFDQGSGVDFFDKKGTLFRGSSNYKKRYSLNGGISGSLTPRSFDDQNKRRWDLRWNHTQKINPTMNLRGNARFVSDERFYDDLSSNRNSRLNQQLRSNLTMDKKWEGSGHALSMNLSRTQNLQTKDITEILPSFNFRVGRKQLFKPTKGNDQRWYNSIYYSYSNRGERQRRLTHIPLTVIIIDSSNDTTIIDTTTEFEDINQKITHSISINSPQKVFKYFTFDPNFNYSEGWINEWYEPVIDEMGVFSFGEDGKIVTSKRGTFKARRTFSTGFRMATKIYGNFTPQIGALSSIRHVITPSIGFRYTPDFSTDLYGYFTTGVDTLGNEVRFDLFQGSAIGNTPSKESRVLNYTISNTFQAKLHEAEENERKVELFNLNLSGSYNYTAEKRKMNPLSASLRTKFIPGANLDISSRYNFYRWIDGSISNEFRLIPRLTNVTFSTSFSLTGDKRTQTDVLQSDAVEQYASDNMDDRFEQLIFNDLTGETWISRISMSYALNKSNPDVTSKTFWLRGDLNFSPTREWSVGYNYNLDLIRKIITNHSVTVQRDLHCWRFSLNWTPSGPGAGYYFIVNVKSSHLSDLKIEERGGRSSLFGR